MIVGFHTHTHHQNERGKDEGEEESLVGLGPDIGLLCFEPTLSVNNTTSFHSIQGVYYIVRCRFEILPLSFFFPTKAITDRRGMDQLSGGNWSMIPNVQAQGYFGTP